MKVDFRKWSLTDKKETVFLHGSFGLANKASQSSRLGCRECNLIDFPATCAAENLPEARLMPRPRADQGGPKPAAMEREYPFYLIMAALRSHDKI